MESPWKSSILATSVPESETPDVDRDENPTSSGMQQLAENIPFRLQYSDSEGTRYAKCPVMQSLHS